MGYVTAGEVRNDGGYMLGCCQRVLARPLSGGDAGEKGLSGGDTGEKGLSGCDTGESGFSAIELVVVVAIIAIMIAIIFPRFVSLMSGARMTETRQDAVAIGAAIELLKIDGTFDSDVTTLTERVYKITGKRFDGEISELSPDGSFLYTRYVGGAAYEVRFDSATGETTDIT